MDNVELQLNNPDIESKGFGAILGLIYKNLILIICIMVLSVIVGFGLAKMKDRTVFKASTSVMLRVSLDEEMSSNTTTDITLAKTDLPDIKLAIKSDKVISYANELYNEYKEVNNIENGGSINAGSISINSNDNSLILTISYSDYSRETAMTKLNMLIESIKVKENLTKFIHTNFMELKPMQNEADITTSNSFWRHITLSFLAGLGIAFLIVFAISVLDTTVKSKKELEGITGTILLACIDDTVLYSKRHKSGY